MQTNPTHVTELGEVLEPIPMAPATGAMRLHNVLLVIVVIN